MCIRLRYLNIFLCSVEEEVDAVVEVAVRREAVAGVAVRVELRVLAGGESVHLGVSLHLIIRVAKRLRRNIAIQHRSLIG